MAMQDEIVRKQFNQWMAQRVILGAATGLIQEEAFLAWQAGRLQGLEEGAQIAEELERARDLWTLEKPILAAIRAKINEK